MPNPLTTAVFLFKSIKPSLKSYLCPSTHTYPEHRSFADGSSALANDSVGITAINPNKKVKFLFFITNPSKQALAALV
jgi:hypothetical protein